MVDPGVPKMGKHGEQKMGEYGVPKMIEQGVSSMKCFTSSHTARSSENQTIVLAKSSCTAVSE